MLPQNPPSSPVCYTPALRSKDTSHSPSLWCTFYSLQSLLFLPPILPSSPRLPGEGDKGAASAVASWASDYLSKPGPSILNLLPDLQECPLLAAASDNRLSDCPEQFPNELLDACVSEGTLFEWRPCILGNEHCAEGQSAYSLPFSPWLQNKHK